MTSRLTAAATEYPNSRPWAEGLPTVTNVNSDNGLSRPIWRRYNGNVCELSPEMCNNAHVCSHCADYSNPHGSWECIATVEEARAKLRANMARAYNRAHR